MIFEGSYSLHCCAMGHKKQSFFYHFPEQAVHFQNKIGQTKTGKIFKQPQLNDQMSSSKALQKPNGQFLGGINSSPFLFRYFFNNLAISVLCLSSGDNRCSKEPGEQVHGTEPCVRLLLRHSNYTAHYREPLVQVLQFCFLEQMVIDRQRFSRL